MRFSTFDIANFLTACNFIDIAVEFKNQFTSYSIHENDLKNWLKNQSFGSYNPESIFRTISSVCIATLDMDNKNSVFAVVFEDPNEFIAEADDIRRELIGVYTERTEAESILKELQNDNELAHLYSIEEWADTEFPL